VDSLLRAWHRFIAVAGSLPGTVWQDNCHGV